MKELPLDSEDTEEEIMTESDSEGVPDLVESSDEESSRPIYSIKPSRDYVDVWLKKSERFLDRQDSQMHVLCLGPFLLGLNSFVPEPWIQALKEVKLLEGNRDTEITALSWSELESTDLVEQVFLVMQKKLRSPANLIACLDLLDKVEEKTIDKISVDKSIELAESEENIVKMWKKMNKSSLCKKNEKQTKFATIYIAKIYHIVVIGVGRDSRDVTDEFKRNRRKIQSVDPAKYKDAGNEQYQHGKYETAADYYTKAAKADPFNHIFFGNRAQTYTKLKRHEEALSDGRRAITLKPDYCKGHYRYAQALADFDKLDYAIAVNKKGYIVCKKSRNKNISETNLNELEQQGKRLCLERDTRIREERIRLVLENKEYGDRFIEEELPAEVRNLPGEKRVIKLHDLLRKTNSPDVEIPDFLSSESSSEEEVENTEKQPANETIKLSETCQKYDILTENLKTLTDKWERDKNQMEFERKLLEYKQKLQLDSLGQRLALGIPTLGSLSKAIQEAEENDENEEGNTNQNALTKKEKKKKGNKKNKKKEEVAKPVKPKKESSPVVNKEAAELQRYLGEAYDRHTKEPQNAATEYSKALKLMADHNLKQLNIEKVEIVTTKYAFGITAISTGNFELIMEGIEKFNDIRRRHSDTRFPLANYGLGKAYTLLNRYSQAVDPVKQGLHMVENQKCVSFYWPGTTIIIEESIPETLQTLLNELLQLALNPPSPDATCRIHCDTEDDRVVIYQTDPDYKGFVRVFCEAKCKVEFHYNCWRVFKSKIGEKIGDKEMLDKPCPTPNCGTIIVKISIYRKDTREKHFESEKMEISKKQEKKKKAAQKTQPAGGQEKMTKAEKKGKKKTEAKEEKSEVMDDINQMLQQQEQEKVETQKADLTGGGDRMEEEVKFPDHTHPVSVLRKDDEDIKLNKYKGTKKQKNKKKKEKAVKATIPVEVNFTDNREKHLLNEHSIPDSPTRDFSVPTNIHEKLQAFESTYESKQVPVQYVYDQITENLFSFFEDLLKAHGPLHVEDTKITSMIEDFPNDAKVKIEQVGGLSNFLKQSLKFAMINDFVCLLKDSVKARHLSLARDNARQMISNSIESSDNVWKTVGKHSSRPEFVTDQFSLSGNAPVDNVLSEDKIKAAILNPYSIKSSGVDSLDDFDDVVKKSSVADLDDDFDFGPMRSGSKMDRIDEIHLISPSKKKKRIKNKISVNHLDDIDSFSSSSGSDSDSLCEDDTGSLNSELSSIRSGKTSSSHKPQVENGRIADLKQNLDISSRSSSKSDLSEKSGNDLSYELMAKAYRNSPVASLYMKEKSPSLSENGRSGDKSLHGLAFPQPLKLPSQLTQRPPAMSLQSEASIAAEQEIDRIDNEMVKEIADDVMQRLMFGKNVSFAERQETYNRVTQDIWKDFNKQRSASSSSVWSLDNKSLYTQMSPSSLDSRQRKNYAEQFMKSHYQNNSTDPLHEKPSFSPSPSTFPYPSKPPISTVNNSFPTLRPPQGGPPPLALPTSFSSVNNYTSNITYPSVNPGIWSSQSGPNVSEGISSMTSFSAPPPPLNLPSFPPGPFGSLSIGTSLTEPSVSTLSSVFGSHNDQCVQVCVQTRDTETNTEPYEQAEFIQSVRECEMLKATVTRLQNQVSEREAMLREWTKRAQSLENNSQQLEMGKKELEDKLRVYEQEVNRLNLDLHTKSTAILELREKINHTEQRYVDLQKQQHDERYRTSQLDQEKLEAVRNREELKKLHEEESQRAKRAEVELLQVKKNFSLQMLERSKMEYMAYKKKVSLIAKRRENEGKNLPEGLKQHLVQYEGILKICDETISRLKGEFDDHIRQVQGGRKMSELPPIFIPPPPPQPQMPNVDMLTGHTMTSVASAPSLLAMGSDALSSGVKSSPSPPLNSSQPAASNILPPSIPSAQLAPQPKPLGLPTGLQGSQRPLMTPSINPMIPSLSQGMIPQHKTSNFDKLIMKLQVAFPQYTRAIFTQLIQELRTKRGGSLSGMTLDEIVSQITDLIHHHEIQQGRNPSVVAMIPKEMGFGDDRVKNPPPGLLGTWGMSGTDLVSQGVSSEVFEEEEDPCVICHEEMTPPTTVMLECKHRFHDECIRKWLREQSTCPNCRIHALLPDEFPSLR